MSAMVGAAKPPFQVRPKAVAERSTRYTKERGCFERQIPQLPTLDPVRVSTVAPQHGAVPSCSSAHWWKAPASTATARSTPVAVNCRVCPTAIADSPRRHRDPLRPDLRGGQSADEGSDQEDEVGPSQGQQVSRGGGAAGAFTDHWTKREVPPLRPPEVAVIVVDPGLSPVANPVASIVATVVSLLVH